MICPDKRRARQDLAGKVEVKSKNEMALFGHDFLCKEICELCISSVDGFCISVDEFCISVDEFCISVNELCLTKMQTARLSSALD